ncbi:hypothetical protein HKX48_008481, partial [Thoreauomyces humboldtii]
RKSSDSKNGDTKPKPTAVAVKRKKTVPSDVIATTLSAVEKPAASGGRSRLTDERQDALLIQLIQKHNKNWDKVAEEYNSQVGVTAKQICKKWHNNLRKKAEEGGGLALTPGLEGDDGQKWDEE